MASLDNVDGVLFEQWLLRSSGGEPWFSDAVITQALTESISTPHSNSLSDPLSPFPTSKPNTVSGSDHETDSKTKRVVSSGRIGKRKPRASKKYPTTFISADAANFRQMVQEVTGGGVSLPPTRFVKPDQQRIAHVYSCLPTLDTSAFLLVDDGYIPQQVVGGADSYSPVAGDGRTGFEFDSFACFPTLESWKVI